MSITELNVNVCQILLLFIKLMQKIQNVILLFFFLQIRVEDINQAH